MHYLKKIEKKSVDELISRLNIKPEDINYIKPKRNVFYLSFFAILFLTSLAVTLLLFDGYGSLRTASGIVLIISMIFFSYDFVSRVISEKKNFKKELLMLKGLSEENNIASFYKLHGGTEIQDSLSCKSLGLWVWDINFDLEAKLAMTDFLAHKFKFEGRKAIDLGCANGSIMDIPSMKKNILYGLDLDIKSLRTINRNVYKGTINATVESLPLKNSTFDLVFMTELIEHLVKPEQALKDIYRILEPEGLFILTTPSRNHFLSWESLNPLVLFKEVLGLYLESFSFPKKSIAVWRDRCFFHTNFSFKELINMLKDNGFEVIYRSSYGFLGALIRGFIKIKPEHRRLLKQLNELEQKKIVDQAYLNLRKKKRLLEERYGKRVGRISVFFQKIPLLRLGGSNLLIVARKI